MSDNNKIWNSLEEIAESVMEGYSVTDKDKIKSQGADYKVNYNNLGWYFIIAKTIR